MDIKKLILYVALGIVCISIYSAWQKDYGYNAQVIAANINTPSANKVITEVEEETAITSNVPASRIINVHTDTLDVSIDTRGGSIIEAKLPKYPATTKDKKIPIKILSNDQENLHIAQSDLLGLNNNQPLNYKAAQENYILQPGAESLEVNLTWSDKNVSVIKTLKFTKDGYAIDVNYKINNRAQSIINAQVFTQIKYKEPKEKSSFFGLRTYSGAAISSHDKPYEKIDYSKMRDTDLSRDIEGGWVAMQQRYFLSAWVPEQNKTYHYYSNVANQIYTIGMLTPFNVSPGSQNQVGVKLYVGPEIAENLTQLNKTLKLTIDYGWLWMISVAIFWIMQQIYNLVGNWGMAIILVTGLIKAIFWKLSDASYRSSAKMRVLTPKIQVLKERYADDRRKLSQATMELYKSEKINPVGGCLPMLIQIPVFIGLYYVLIESVQLRQAPFMLWIIDLSTKDPYYVLPLLMGLSMFLQQKLNPMPADPAQAKMFMLMPIVFTILFASFPSGLVLYWFINNVISVSQQWCAIRKYENKIVHHKKR